MADNYLEKRYEQYQARKAAWERAHKQYPSAKRRMPQPLPFHHFTAPTAGIARPEKFTYPFCYTPHPLCTLAAEEVQRYLAQRTEWAEELKQGKMFGVLVVETETGELGYLAAFSGILAGKNRHPFFAPPVYDLLQPDGFFKKEEEQISAINLRIRTLEEEEERQTLIARLAETEEEARRALDEERRRMKAAKEARHLRRQQATDPAGEGLTAEEEAALIRESQFQKAELKRKERAWQQQIEGLKMQLTDRDAAIQALKQERKRRSAALQQRLFQQFRMRNYRGEERDLCSIFAETVHQTPPAGAGECAAPKLLQQAYLHHWKPVAMAEFWWGDSPKTEIRRHGHYYPACKSKCEPILNFMLQGLDIEENPLLKTMRIEARMPEVIYEDRWLLVLNKPAGMLSVAGKEAVPSVESLLRECYPDTDSPLIVHRLDMATSGLLVVAKDKKTHEALQTQFEAHTVRKRYVALLEGTVEADRGKIELPLCPDIADRPRQMVHPEQGKWAVTEYEVLTRSNGRTRIALSPLTGRTHQLRVHAAHPEGLHCPIVGDTLYGQASDRLYLHAEMLEFIHPGTGEQVRFMREADF